MRSVSDASANCTKEIVREKEKKQFWHIFFRATAEQHFHEGIRTQRDTVCWWTTSWYLCQALPVYMHIKPSGMFMVNECNSNQDVRLCVFVPQVWACLRSCFLKDSAGGFLKQSEVSKLIHSQSDCCVRAASITPQRSQNRAIAEWSSDNESLPTINSRGDGPSSSRWWIQ